MMNKLLLAAAAAALSSCTTVSVSAQSHSKTNDPKRIISAAESIDIRLQHNHKRLRRRVETIELQPNPNDNDFLSSSSSFEQYGITDADVETTLELEEKPQQPQVEQRDLSSSSSTTQDHRTQIISPLSFSSTLGNNNEEVVVAADTKIIGGIESSPNRYPYLASLSYFGTHLCGGSLVAKDIVLSAAHCSGYSSHIELGRYDKTEPFDEALHERIEVAYEIKHPGWDPNTVDNDFMLMKLVRPAVGDGREIVKLNRDGDFPSIPGEKVTLMGWGDTNEDPDVNTPSMQLLEVELEYVPDDICRDKEGMVGPDTVSYASRITENMMCAMDEDGGRGGSAVDEDTCLGDSGGPMVIPMGEGKGDLQVGVVSWGIGCASPIFPGVYSRISSQYEWIRKTTCQHSSLATEGFECNDTDDESSAGFAMSEEDEEEIDESQTYVTLEISLDDQPQEFSWMVSTLAGTSSQMIATVPPGFYSGYTSYTFHHKLLVNDGQFYRISLRDTFGDGLKGYVAVYRGTVPILSHLIMYERLFYDEDRTDFKRIDHAFFTGSVPPNYFSLAITFDKFPKDLWWKLESETDNVILEQRPPGWYNERFELMSIIEPMVVFGPSRLDEVSYRFTIGDSYPCDTDPTQTCGDGICCNYGKGKYQLYAGHPSSNQLLTEGGEYELTDSLIITPPMMETRQLEEGGTESVKNQRHSGWYDERFDLSL